ncbi:MAG: HPF/RaiA family ribosome-associated protein [Gemmatimonadales bacterium]|nr:HPF/RaiA family ribosome-associated protein [Gemmatimonadales bacterium]MYG48091.1 HPF/RaiA family ribosome-associated protein [Gemmatimonadales bacterium]MYK00938.1 HPF/RaiA family ribosome-associated protein [Candidatus Palauibacter ramosifaciens]
MRTIVTARSTDVSDIREIIETRFTNLARFEPRASKAEIVFTGEKAQVRAAAVISVDRARPVHGEAVGPDPRTALDRLAEKLGNQLRRNHDRYNERSAPPMDELFGNPFEAGGEAG